MRRSPLLRKYISYNILFILVPMLILIAVYASSALGQIISEHEASLSHALTQSMRSIDADMDALQQTAGQIALDAEVTPYQLQQGRYDTVTAISTLRGYHTRVNYLQSLMLYLRGGDKLYAGAGIMDLSLIGTARYPFLGGWDLSGLTAMLDAAVPYGISPPGMGIRYNTVDCMVITYPWARPAMTAIGSVAGLLPMDYFSGIIVRPESDAAVQTGLVTTAGTWLYRDGDNDLLSAALGQDLPEGKSRITLLGETVTAIRLTSEKTGWTYLQVLEHGQFLPRLLTDHGLVLTWVSILLLVCIAIGILIAVRNYLPIRRLDRMLDAGEMEAEGNELHRIGATLQRLSASNRTMQKQLDDSRALRQEQLIYRLLHARAPQAEGTVQALAELGITFTGPLCVILISGSTPLPPAARERLMERIAGAGMSAYPAETGVRDYIAVLCDLQGVLVPQRAGGLMGAIAGGGMPLVRMACGQAYPELDRAGRSLAEAISAMETSGVKAGQVAYFAEKGSEGEDWMPPRGQLAQWLAQGDEELVADALRGLDALLQTRGMASDMLRTRFVAASIVQQVLPLMEAAGVAPDADALERLVHFSDAHDFLQQLTAMTDRVLGAQQAQRAQRQNEQFDRMILYIGEHFGDATFGLKSMAAELDMTSSYLSRFFRDHADMNFSDYVTKLRMERACELLRTGDLRIREVMEQVGYLDVASFTRKFTQVMGISPGRYRDTYRAQRKEDE